MKGRIRAALILLVVIGLGAYAFWAWSGRDEAEGLLSGYVEGDDLFLSSPVAGTVAKVLVAEGQRVQAGAEVFAMDPATLSAQQGQAAARVRQAQDQVAAAQAQARQAQANLEAARTVEAGARRDHERLLALQRSNPQAVAALQVDQARASAESAAAQRQAAERFAEAAAVQARAAEAATAQAGAAEEEAGVRLGQLAPRAPVAGRVQEVFFQPGEWAAANQPIVAILPDDQVKLRFYVPEGAVAAYAPGKVVRFSCDGCAPDLEARISKVASRPEFTPPVIYSRSTRSKLVFLVEAVPLKRTALAPGQPIDVTPLVATERRR